MNTPHDFRTLLADVGQALYGARWVRPLASRLGTSAQAVSLWSRGEREPTAEADMLRTMNEAAGASIGDLQGIRRRIAKRLKEIER